MDDPCRAARNIASPAIVFGFGRNGRRCAVNQVPSKHGTKDGLQMPILTTNEAGLTLPIALTG
jgi:hypothetical protein